MSREMDQLGTNIKALLYAMYYNIIPTPGHKCQGTNQLSSSVMITWVRNLQYVMCLSRTGSVPNSPELPRKNVRQLPEHPTRSFISSRPPLQRAQTVARPPGGLRTSSTSNALQGPLMNVCKDCKTMIVNIIRSSRTQLAKAPETAKQKVQMPSLRRFHSFRTPRNFHLDLKPVYK